MKVWGNARAPLAGDGAIAIANFFDHEHEQEQE
jgi:hypothetical protein